MVKIKKKLGDFKVKELMDLELNAGQYSYFLLKKIDYNTLDALKLLSKKLRVPLKNFGFAGNKDKYAETEQYISILNFRKKIKELNFGNIGIRFIGNGKKRINLGDNLGNEFEIRVYDYEGFFPVNFFINYFGEQRFGKENWIIGRKIVKKELINIEFRKKRFCLSSYQSYLWNSAVKTYLEQNYKNTFEIGNYVFLNEIVKNIKIPLINFDTKLKGKILKIYCDLMNQEDIKREDFIFRTEPRLITETVYRDLIAKVDKVIFKNDILRFRLPKGSYATVFIRKLFREDIENV